MEIRPFETEAARVAVEAGRTLNAGNYESFRISIRLEVPCYVEEVLDVYQDTLLTVHELLEVESERAISAIRGEGDDEDDDE